MTKKAIQYLHILFIIVFVFVVAATDSASQNQIKSILNDSLLVNKPDSTFSISSIDSLQNIEIDSLAVQDTTLNIKRIPTNNSSLDTNVTYYGRDSVIFNFPSKRLRIKGNSTLDYGNQKLEAEIIELYLDDYKLLATPLIDSIGNITGIPKFNDNGEEFTGKKINFNFKTKRGTISEGETEMEEGFYFGSKIKKVSDNCMYVQDGMYTTCDNPMPHFHFASGKMKIIPNDRILLEDVVIYVEDMPILPIPFGLFFPSQSGRKSGIIIPSFFFSKQRGVVFEELGYYWAASDYWDTKLTANLYSRAGYMFMNETRWVLTDRFNGKMNLSYGRVKNSNDEYSTAYEIIFNHKHTFNPTEYATFNLNFASTGFNTLTSTNINQRVQQEMKSSASYSKTFDNGHRFSASYTRDFNIVTGSYTQNIPLSYNANNILPKLPGFLEGLSLRYTANARYWDNRNIDLSTVDSIPNDTSFKYKKVIEHRPSISINPKLGHFTLTPSLSFSANNYLRQVSQEMNPTDSSITQTYKKGFFTDYRYSMSLSAKTKLFGIVDKQNPFLFIIDPNWLGAKAFRHTYEPSLSFSYTPDQSSNTNSFGRYYNYKTDKEVIYSKYLADGGLASSRLSKSLRYSDNHTFEMKIAQGDTLDDLNIQLLRLSTNFSYDFAKDSMGLSDISMSYNSDAIKFGDKKISLNGSASFSPYETMEGSYSLSARNSYLWDNNKFPLRLNQASLSLSTNFSFSNSGSKRTERGIFDNPDEVEEDTATADTEKVNYNSRFSKRQKHEITDVDLFGDSSPGYSQFSVPFSTTLNFQVQYNNNLLEDKLSKCYLNASFNFDLTNSWKVTLSGGYDFVKMNLNVPTLTFNKTIHCWNLYFQWIPLGFNRGFYLKFSANASQLKDLMLEKRNYPIYR